jgi:hypothetical protein
VLWTAEAGPERSLDDLIPGPGKPTSLRWVYQHMIEEYACHHGHADLVRERLDGVTRGSPAAVRS